MRRTVLTVTVCGLAFGCGSPDPDVGSKPKAATVQATPEKKAEADEPDGTPVVLSCTVVGRAGGARLAGGYKTTLPFLVHVTLPEAQDVKGFTGELTVRSLDEPAKVLWSGPVTYSPMTSVRDEAIFTVEAPYDEADAGLREIRDLPGPGKLKEMRGAVGLPAEVRLESIRFADDTADLLDHQ